MYTLLRLASQALFSSTKNHTFCCTPSLLLTTKAVSHSRLYNMLVLFKVSQPKNGVVCVDENEASQLEELSLSACSTKIAGDENHLFTNRVL